MPGNLHIQASCSSWLPVDQCKLPIKIPTLLPISSPVFVQPFISGWSLGETWIVEFFGIFFEYFDWLCAEQQPI